MSNPYEPYGQQQPGYPQSGQLPQQPGYGQPVAVVMAPMTKTNGMAIASLICGIIGVLTADFLVIPGILAVIFGHVALNQIKKNSMMTGRGLAITGLILGYLQVAVDVGFCLFYVIVVLIIGAAATSSSSGGMIPFHLF